MALTEFVRNVDDLSDDGGYKFRFRCDRCRDGVESHYKPAATNLLKTGLEIFQMFRPLGGARRAVDGIDRGLRGKERDKAYQEAIEAAKSHFAKCSSCGNWVCKHCYNDEFSLCEGCAPNASESGARALAEKKARERVEAIASGTVDIQPLVCAACQQPSGGGRFCEHCGASQGRDKCPGCGAALKTTAKFCSECGQKVG